MLRDLFKSNCLARVSITNLHPALRSTLKSTYAQIIVSATKANISRPKDIDSNVF